MFLYLLKIFYFNFFFVFTHPSMGRGGRGDVWPSGETKDASTIFLQFSIIWQFFPGTSAPFLNQTPRYDNGILPYTTLKIYIWWIHNHHDPTNITDTYQALLENPFLNFFAIFCCKKYVDACSFEQKI